MKRYKMTTDIRERIYGEDLKKAANIPVETKLRNVLLLSDFCRYLNKMRVKFKK